MTIVTSILKISYKYYCSSTDKGEVKCPVHSVSDRFRTPIRLLTLRPGMFFLLCHGLTNLFSKKDYIGNIFGFLSYLVSSEAIQLCCYSTKAPTNYTTQMGVAIPSSALLTGPGQCPDSCLWSPQERDEVMVSM